MYTPLTAGNPFSDNRYGFLWEILKETGRGVHLDYGAYDGKVVKALKETGVIDAGTGVDLNARVVEASIGTMPSGVNLLTIHKGVPLSFDGYPGLIRPACSTYWSISMTSGRSCASCGGWNASVAAAPGPTNCRPTAPPCSNAW